MEMSRYLFETPLTPLAGSTCPHAHAKATSPASRSSWSSLPPPTPTAPSTAFPLPTCLAHPSTPTNAHTTPHLHLASCLRSLRLTPLLSHSHTKRWPTKFDPSLPRSLKTFAISVASPLTPSFCSCLFRPSLSP